MSSEFHDLLLAEMPRMRCFALALTRNRTLADDLLQETALRAWEFQTQFSLGTNFKGWIYRILRNAHINSFRLAQRPPTTIDSVSEEVLGRSGDQENRVLAQEILLALSKIAHRHREVLFLVAVSGLDYEEAATAIGCSVGTIKSRLHRARREMEKLLQTDTRDATETCNSDGGTHQRPVLTKLEAVLR